MTLVAAACTVLPTHWEFMNRDPLRQQMVRLLDGVGAHMPFEEAIADFPDDAINVRPPNVDYTPWHLVEHLRLTQADILDYVDESRVRRDGVAREYWPDRARPRPAPNSTRRSPGSSPTRRPSARWSRTRP